ncbi:MAG: TerB family tellurite resistance protein [Myxococcales bacterium]|nr:TerB family tellurite resistance protein [Myxococcales bacterium]
MQTRVWLIPLADALGRAPRFAPPADRAPSPATGDPFEDALAAELCARGYDRGLLVDRLAALELPGQDAIDFHRYSLHNHTAHRLDLGLALLHAAAPPDPARDTVRLFAALAFAHERPRLAERALALLDDDPHGRRFVRGLNAVAGALGAALEADALPADHPLLGHPFHQLLRYVDARSVARVVRLVAAAPDGRPAPEALDRVLGLARTALHQAVSAAIALAAADGVVDPPERALIEALMRAARFDDAALAMHRAEFDDPAAPDAIAARLDGPATRPFLLHLLFLGAHVNGRYHPAERGFIERFAAAAGEDPDALAAYEAEALATYERRPDLVERLALDGAVARLRNKVQARVERAIRDNGRRLWSEIQETGELVALLNKARSTPLDPTEDAAVRAQLIDICKAIPALALFAVPGGSILLPLVIRHLPFDLLPSSFRDEARLTLDQPAIELPEPEAT